MTEDLKRSAPGAPPRARRGRAAWAVLLFLSLLWLGIGLGTSIGARFFVPAGSGLAGPAIALSYGVLGMAVGALLAFLLAWKAPSGLLRGVALVALVLALLQGAILAWRNFDLRAQRRAEAGLDQPLPPPVPGTLSATSSKRVDKRSYRELEIDGATWEFRYKAVAPGASWCKGRLVAAEAEALRTVLAALDRRTRAGRPPCADLKIPDAELRPPDHIVRWLPASGGQPPADEISAWSFSAGYTCTTKDADVGLLQRTLWRIPVDAGRHARVSCEGL